MALAQYRNKLIKFVGPLSITLCFGFLAATDATALTRYSNISAANSNGCGLISGGGAACWGENASGQLGANGPAGTSSKPIAITGLTGVVQAEAGDIRSCALMFSGSINCWGSNYEGGLGNNSMDSSSATPVQVFGISNAIQLSARGRTACATLDDGTIRCWGSGDMGEIGDGAKQFRRAPAQVSGITTAKQVAAGPDHSCALLADRTLRCWGYNGSGNLGNGNTADSATPVQVSGISTATGVSVGGSNSCAVLMNKTVRCWGSNSWSDGQNTYYTGLGNGSQAAYSSTPVEVSGIDNAKQVSVGTWSSCAALISGKVKCWGIGEKGLMGNGSESNAGTPVLVSGISTATSVSVALSSACARLVGGGLKCWGFNRDGQLGDGSQNYGVNSKALTPVSVFDTPEEIQPGDEDGDGLPNLWEVEAVDTTGDGTPDLDLAAMGADPRHKDLFVEVDYMPDLQLSSDAIDDVVKSFDRAPVNNPDGTTGINLHVDNGPNSVMNPKTGETWGNRSKSEQIANAAVLGVGDADHYNWGAFDIIKASHLDSARLPVFRYAVSANRYGNAEEESSGLARGIPSSDMIIALGRPCTTRAGNCLLGWLKQAGTFMHELGHTMGLHHGGNDELNNKPNYLSVMNYSFQFTGPLKRDMVVGDPLVDYSRYGPNDLPTLDENALSEADGFSKSDRVSGYHTKYAREGRFIRMNVASMIDFNGDGDVADVIQQDINDDTHFDRLESFADWPNLQYAAGAIGGAGAVLPSVTENNEPSITLLQSLADVGFDGGDNGGGDDNPTAKPSVKTGKVKSIGRSRATFYGSVNPQGLNVEVRFQYRKKKKVTSTPWVAIKPGSKDVSFKKKVSKLKGNTSYRVRAVVRSGSQIILGAEKKFKTRRK